MSHEHIYSILIVSSSTKFNMLSSYLFPIAEYWPVDTVPDAASAKQKMMERTYDIIVINTPLPDEMGTRLATEICTGSSSCVMLLTNKESYEEVKEKMDDYGVVVVLKPVSVPAVSKSLKIMCATRQRIKQIESRQKSIEKKIDEIKVLNKAKWLLIGYMKMTESEAQHYIERTAMDTRLSKAEVAKNIIRTYQDYH
ncbi:MAG: response regulator [Spirochaetia bacterium]|nr:response regulator [Spirochaetia bacterium]